MSLLIPSAPCLPRVRCRRRARSASSESAVGIEQRRQPVGGLTQPFGPRIRGDPRQVVLGGLAGLVVHAVGQLREEPADDLRCSAPICPLPARPPTWASRGGSGSPVIALRGPRSSASSIRWRASSVEIRKPGSQHIGQVGAPQLAGEASVASRAMTGDRRRVGSADGFQPPQHRQQLGMGQTCRYTARPPCHGRPPARPGRSDGSRSAPSSESMFECYRDPPTRIAARNH